MTLTQGVNCIILFCSALSDKKKFSFVRLPPEVIREQSLGRQHPDLAPVPNVIKLFLQAYI